MQAQLTTKALKGCRLFRAIVNKTRAKIITFLQENKKGVCVSDIETHIQLDQSATSQHLKILRDADVVTNTRKGQFIIYTLNTSVLKKAESFCESL